MNKYLILPIIFLVAAMLVACATSPGQESFDINSADFSSAETDKLCIVYGSRMDRYQDAKAELINRNVFTDREWKMIETRTVAPGLSECGVKAAYPLDVAKYYFHKDTDGNPIGQDMVFSCDKAPVPHCPFTKVEIRDGKVTAVVLVSEP
jgi:hypothetical protein